MSQQDKNIEHPTPKGGRLNRKLRPQLAVLIILLECTVVLALVSHVITVSLLPEPLPRMTIARPPAPAPSAMQQKKSPETQRATDTATHRTKSEAFDPFAGIIEGIAQSMAVQGDFTKESNYDGDYHSQPLIFDLMLRDCNCQDCESPQRSVIDGGYGLNELNQNLNGHDVEVPLLIMQGTNMVPDDSSPASETDGPKVMSLKEFTERYGPIHDYVGPQ